MLVQGRMNWYKTADVVVIGYGMAGAVAAITAHDEGSNVLILEKQPSRDHHTNSSLSGGAFLSPSSIDDAVIYMEALYHSNGGPCWTDREVIRAWAEYSHKNRDWIEKLGVESRLVATVGEHRDLQGTDSIHLYMFPGGGARMMKFLYKQVRD